MTNPYSIEKLIKTLQKYSDECDRRQEESKNSEWADPDCEYFNHNKALVSICKTILEIKELLTK